jgi:hypothetical protein
VARFRFNVFIFAGDCGGWTVTAGVIADTGRGFQREGDGDKFVEPFLLGGLRPLSIASLSLPLAANTASPVESPSSSRAGKFFTGSPALPLRIKGFGEIALGAMLFGFELAICSKWERREDTGFYQYHISIRQQRICL